MSKLSAVTVGEGPSNMKERRRVREDQVFEAAVEVISQKGFAAASIQDIADRLGILKGSLYYYIKSKEHLLFRIFDLSHQQGKEIIDSVAALNLPALRALHEYFFRYTLWYLKNLNRVSIYAREWKSLTGERYEIVVKQRRVYEQFLYDLIEAAKADGDIPESLDTKFATFFVLGGVNAVPDWYRAAGETPPERIASLYANFVVAVLTCDVHLDPIGTADRSVPPDL